MAYGKRRFKSRGRFSRVRRRRGGARRAKKFIKRVVRQLSEVKYRIASAFGNFNGSSGYVATITPTFPQGVDKTNRIGNKIRYKMLQLRMNLYLRQGAVAGFHYTTMRVILFQTRLPLGAIPANALNLDNVFQTPNISSSINNQSVRVLMDKTRNMMIYDPAAQHSLNLSNCMTMKKKIRVHNNVNFKNAAEVLPQDPKDNYYILVICDAALNNIVVDYNWVSRLSFIDI